MLQEKSRQIKITIIVVSLLIHGGVAFFLLIPELHHPFIRPMPLFTDDIHTHSQTPDSSPEIQEIPTSSESTEQQVVEESSEWAEMKMGGGTFGAPVEFIEYADVPEYGDPNGDAAGAEASQEESSALPQEPATQPHEERTQPATTTTFIQGDAPQTIVDTQPKTERKKRKKIVATKGVTLAHLARGYLDSLDEGGSILLAWQVTRINCQPMSNCNLKTSLLN